MTIRQKIGRPVVPRFIVMEGLDGAGTTTQSELLQRRLIHAGQKAWLTSEPTDGPIGRLIRQGLSGSPHLRSETFALLYAADRAEHLNGYPDGIKHRCKEGWVVCDRYFFSSLAYQGIDCDGDYIESLNGRFPLPQWLLFLDIDPEESARRRSERARSKQTVDDIFERQSVQQAVYHHYGQVLDRYADCGMAIRRIPDIGGKEAVADEIWTELFPVE